MKLNTRYRHLCRALALGAAMLAQPVLADDQAGVLNIDASPAPDNLDDRLKVNNDPKLFAYNQIMYIYDIGDRFDALNELQIYKAGQVLPETDVDSETLLGNLYTILGLPDQADAIFTRAINNDTIAATRNLTWFNKGKLQFQRGNYEAAKQIFVSPQANLAGDYDSQRRIMLANILAKTQRFSEARHVLSPVPLNNVYGAYATYNMGIANIRAQHFSEGIGDLNRVMTMAVGSNENNALKDRAALAIGFTWLQKKQPDKAHDALVNIRLDGPFSNQALLALGYAHFQKQEYKKALSFWIELQKRNPSDPYVQETLLLTPRAFEELGALPQAMDGYKQAADILRKQIVVAEKLQEALADPQWLEVLAPDALKSITDDPLTPLETTAASNKGETLFLYQLLASNDFNEAFKQYQQLRRLQWVMVKRSQDLKALQDVAGNIESRGDTVDVASQRISALKARFQRMQQHWEAIQVAAQDAGANNEDFASIATDADQRREHQLAAMLTALDQMPASLQVTQLKQRVKRLQGLSLWVEATDAPVAQDDMLKRLQNTDNDMQALQQRLLAVQALLDDNNHTISAHPRERIDQLGQRLLQVQTGVETAENEYRDYMRKQALSVLLKRRVKLNSDLADAYLNLARLQDQVINKDDSKDSGSPANSPGPAPGPMSPGNGPASSSTGATP